MASDDRGDIGAPLNQALADMGQALGIWAKNVERLMREAGVLPPEPPFDDPLRGVIADEDRLMNRFRFEVGRITGREFDADTTPPRLLSALIQVPSKATRDKVGKQRDDRIEELGRQVLNRKAEVERSREETVTAGREKFKAELDARQKGERIELLEGQLAELRALREDDERFENETGYLVALSRLRREVDEVRRNARVSIDHAEQRMRANDSRFAILEQESMGKDREIAEQAAELAELRKPARWWSTYGPGFIAQTNRLTGADLPPDSTAQTVLQALNNSTAKGDPPWWPHYRAEFVEHARRVSGWESKLEVTATPNEILQALGAGLSADDRDHLQAAEVHLSDELAKATARAEAAERQLAALTKNRDEWAESARAVKTRNEQLLRELEAK